MKKSLLSTAVIAGSLLIATAAHAMYKLSPEERMAKALSLTEAQQVQIGEAREVFEARMKEARAEFKLEVDSVLTDEQKVKRDEMEEKFREHMINRKKDRMMSEIGKRGFKAHDKEQFQGEHKGKPQPLEEHALAMKPMKLKASENMPPQVDKPEQDCDKLSKGEKQAHHKGDMSKPPKGEKPMHHKGEKTQGEKPPSPLMKEGQEKPVMSELEPGSEPAESMPMDVMGPPPSDSDPR